MTEQMEQKGAGGGNIDFTPLEFVEENFKTRKQCVKWFFTFNNYSVEQMEQMEQLLKEISKKFIFQEEIGEETGTPHLQGCFWLKKRRRLAELVKITAYISNTIYMRPVRSWEHSINYCSKDKTASGKRFYQGIKIKKKIKILCEDKFYIWENNIIDIIKTEPDDRSIYWFWEEIGNVGKTTFCKYLCVKHNAIILSGKHSDMKFGIVKYIEKHGEYPELIIMDIPRTTENYLSYTGIEEVKNGLFFSSKYECDMVIGNCPHLIIFANFEPCEDRLSKDRWKVFEITQELMKTKKEKRVLI